ncbi:MAG: radical SAM protein [Desulfobacterales bacterium]|nr:MAG: radical SAM protein [Desulfobacterales bacterium]
MASRPFIVPVFIPHAGCPHQCVFCDQGLITSRKSGICGRLPEKTEMVARIRRFISWRRDSGAAVEIAFFGGNFLGLPPGRTAGLLALAQSFIDEGAADGIRFSTRPDTVTPDRLTRLAGFSVSTVEVGIQSMDDAVLRKSRRGHTRRDARNAARLVRESGYRLGLQMMTHLPGQDHDGALATGRELASLEPDFVRIYPTVVLKNSPLDRMRLAGDYVPATLEESVETVAALLGIFTEADIPVIRMGLQPDEGLISGGAVTGGPFHPAFGHLVHSRIFLDRAAARLNEAKISGGAVELRVHPRNISRMRGQKNENIRQLCRRFHLSAVTVTADETLALDRVRLAGDLPRKETMYDGMQPIRSGDHRRRTRRPERCHLRETGGPEDRTHRKRGTGRADHPVR